jgi:hypothetical protein
MTRNATFGLNRSVLEHERTLFIGVTLDASRINPGGQSGLLQLEPAVRIMAVTASHSPFKNLVMERRSELMFDLVVTAQAQLGLADFK